MWSRVPPFSVKVSPSSIHGAFDQRDAYGRGTQPTPEGRALLAAYTNVQIVNHAKLYAGCAPRHEIVMLHWREWESLAVLASAQEAA